MSAQTDAINKIYLQEEKKQIAEVDGLRGELLRMAKDLNSRDFVKRELRGESLRKLPLWGVYSSLTAMEF